MFVNALTAKPFDLGLSYLAGRSTLTLGRILLNAKVVRQRSNSKNVFIIVFRPGKGQRLRSRSKVMVKTTS